MAATCGAPITPSDDVDHAWHLHLTYTRHYWETLCQDILGRALHHTPTEGGPDERRRYHAQYAATLELYRETFGERPPADIWPDPDTRFGLQQDRTGRPLRVAGAMAATLLLTACGMLAANAPHGSAGRLSKADMDAIILGIFVFVALASLIFGKRGTGGDGGCSIDFGGDGGGDSGCGGGCGGGCG